MFGLSPPFVLLIAVLLAVVLVEAILVAWLWRRHWRLEQSLREWEARQRRQHQDIAGLCAAGLQVDARLARLERMLAETREWLQAAGPAEGTGGAVAYQTAIERIREGAGVEELVSECGFTREEANLLIRLHRDETGAGFS
ncbi:hypothetical protein MIT9_P1180 [Methylomarinovum caldicuralii]|uniref:DUF2802 domain-containing protein n=1 Tax=Methylomarinovum caldicuralii TaxID=438856 RepID=A0AAU9BZW6_9GAMM|nr:DUF2802 domain-containing protein [Methylomarinovum caldicuralii]BCX81602.1 hypothetical protein MIT9_P1180 [Methylomarinovum caldicuralii]